MRKPLSHGLAVFTALLALRTTVLAAAPKQLNSAAAQQASGAATDQDGSYDKSQQKASAAGGGADAVKPNLANQSSAPPDASAASKRLSPDGQPRWATPDKEDPGKKEPGAFSSFMSSGAPWILGGGLAGCIIGGLVGGPFGFLLGGMLGVIGGYVAHTVLPGLFAAVSGGKK